MSHNKINVGNQEPSSSSEINISLNDLSDVDTSSVASGNMLGYNGSSFVPTGSTETGLDLHAGIFQRSGGYGAGNYYFAVNDYSMIRKMGSSATLYSSTGSTAIFNNASSNSPVSTSAWTESIDVATAGTYLCIAGAHCVSGTSITWQWENNAGNFGAKTFVRNNTNAYGGLVVAVMTATTNDIFRIVVTAKSGSVKIPNDEEQWMTGMTIIKLG